MNLDHPGFTEPLDMSDEVLDNMVEHLECSAEDIQGDDIVDDEQMFKEMDQMGAFVEDLAVEVVIPTSHQTNHRGLPLDMLTLWQL